MDGTESDDASGRPRLPETFDNTHTCTSLASVSLIGQCKPGLTLGWTNSLRPRATGPKTSCISAVGPVALQGYSKTHP